MLEKIVFWFGMNRKKIEYTLGGLTVLSGLSLLGSAQSSNGILQIFVGSVIVFDAWSMP